MYGMQCNCIWYYTIYTFSWRFIKTWFNQIIIRCNWIGQTYQVCWQWQLQFICNVFRIDLRDGSTQHIVKRILVQKGGGILLFVCDVSCVGALKASALGIFRSPSNRRIIAQFTQSIETYIALYMLTLVVDVMHLPFYFAALVFSTLHAIAVNF